MGQLHKCTYRAGGINWQHFPTHHNHLISSDNAIATVVAEANANLPARAKVFFANGGHDLMLRVRPPAKGFVIEFK